MPKIRWLGRTLMVGPCLTLCTDADEYAAVCKHLEVEPDPYRGGDTYDGAVHTYRKDGVLVCVVCVTPGDKTEDAMLGILVHEAVHVWHAHCDDIADRRPSEESSAYGIAAIAQELMTVYLSRGARV